MMPITWFVLALTSQEAHSPFIPFKLIFSQLILSNSLSFASSFGIHLKSIFEIRFLRTFYF